MEEVRERFPGGYEARGLDIVNYRPPGGESFADLSDRIWPAFASIADSCASETRPVVVVAHAGVNRVLLCRLLGMPLANLFRLKQGYGCCNVVHAVKGGYRVEVIMVEFRME